MSKRKFSGSSSAAKRGRPELWAVEDVKAYISSLGLESAAKKLVDEEIDGATLMDMSSQDLQSIKISALAERKKVEAAISDMTHPLMPAFASADVDGSFTIDADELGHVMTRVNGTPMMHTQLRAMLVEADLNEDGELDFNEFKEIMESNTKSTNWNNAGKELGVSAKFLAAGDAALAPAHQMFRAGSIISKSAPTTAPPRRIPSVGFRLMSFWFGTTASVLLTFISLGIYFFWSTFVLGSRGQLSHQWLFGTKFVNYRDGSNPGFLKTVLAPLGIAILMAPSAFIAGLLCGALRPDPVQAGIFANLLGAIISYGPLAYCFIDPEGRTYYDVLLDVVVVYDEGPTWTPTNTHIHNN
jgi:Ca2+-binding EF-hand superfamily protein